MTRNIKTQAARMAFRGETQSPSPEAIAASVAAILKKAQDDPNRAIETLLGENAKLREEKRSLKERVHSLETNAPKDGDLILTGPEIEEWEELRKLGSLSDIKKAIEERESLAKKVGEIERGETIGQAAEAAGFKKSVLSKLADGLEIEFKEVPKQNQKGETVVQKVPFVKTPQGLKTLVDYAEESWKEFMPSLKAEESRTQGQPSGVQYHSNGSGGTGETGQASIVDSFLKQANEARTKGNNPLMPQGQ